MTSNTLISVAITVLALVFVVGRQRRARPLSERSLVALPLILCVIGYANISSASGRTSLSSANITFGAIDVIVGVILGVARAASVNIFERNGVLWRQGTWLTMGLWVVSIAIRAIIAWVAGHDKATIVGTDGVTLSLGVSLLVQGGVLWFRGSRMGIPFAQGRRAAYSPPTAPPPAA